MPRPQRLRRARPYLLYEQDGFRALLKPLDTPTRCYTRIMLGGRTPQLLAHLDHGRRASGGGACPQDDGTIRRQGVPSSDGARALMSRERREVIDRQRPQKSGARQIDALKHLEQVEKLLTVYHLDDIENLVW